MNDKNHRVENIVVDHCGICKWYDGSITCRLKGGAVGVARGACGDFELDPSCAVEDPKPAEKKPPRYCHECRWMGKRTLYCNILRVATNYGQEIPVRDGKPCGYFREFEPSKPEPKSIPRVFMYGKKKDGKWDTRILVLSSGLVVERRSKDGMGIDKWCVDGNDELEETIDKLLSSGDYEVVDK